MRKGDKRLKYEDRKEIEKMKAANTADSLTMAAYNKKMEPSIKTIQSLVDRDEILNEYMMGNLLAIPSIVPLLSLTPCKWTKN